jgi:hypothetical protein
MLTKTLLLLLALLDTSQLFCQNIDSLRTKEEVLSFVRKLNPIYSNVYIDPPKPVFGLDDYQARIKSFGSFAYEKADFDGNGLTDLLFNGYVDDYEGNKECKRFAFVVLSFGKDSFQIKELTQGHFIQFFAARKIPIEGNNCIVTLNVEGEFIDDSKVYVYHNITDTLNYVAGEFIERCAPNKDTIDKIEFCAFGGLGFFAGIKLSITDTFCIMESGTSLQKPHSTIDSGGIFQTTLDWATHAKILGLLQNIDFTHLKDDYQVSWSDDLFGLLKITYNKNKVKVIKDYGLIGTYGLAALQNVLIELRDSQHWKLIKQISDDYLFCSE